MERDIWAELSDEVRAEVDALVLRGRHVQAVWVIRNAFPDPKPGIPAVVDVIGDRYEELAVLPTAPVVDRTELFAAAETLPFRPDAVEAVWDGDTDGWFVQLLAVRAEPREESALAVLRHGTELQLFDGPPAPSREAGMARIAGRAVAEHLGVPFHFASPDTPDEEAPRWWDSWP